MATGPYVVLGRFPPPIDGQTIATEQLAALLDEQGPVERVSLSAPEAEVAFGVRFRPRRVLHYAASARRLRQEINRSRGSRILWTSISPSPLGHARDWLTVVPAFGRQRLIYAVVHHGDFQRLFERRLTRWSARRLVRRLAGVVFLTEKLSEGCAPWIPSEKRFVIPNTILRSRVSTDNEVTLKRLERAGRKELRVLFVSNMVPSKGYGDLLTALSILRQEGNVTARFVGRWPSEAAARDFRSQTVAHGLSGIVQHLGSISDDDKMREYYLWADAFVLPTYYPTEAQPLVLLEALSAGTPVVTTRQGGIPEMVRDGIEGIFVQPRQPEAIACALTSLRDETSWLVKSEAARARFVSVFSGDAVRAQWCHLLDQGDPHNFPRLESSIFAPAQNSRK